MTEAERLALADVGEVDQVRDLADLFELVALAARLEKRLELDRHVEVILDGVLAAAGDQDDVVDARRHRFLDAVLDDRLVDQRQHLLGLRFGRREKTGAEAGGREHGFANGGVTPDRSRGYVTMLSRARRMDHEVACSIRRISIRDHLEEVRAGLRNRGLDPDKALEEIATLKPRAAG